MTARYEPIARWRIPRGVAEATLRGVLRAARDNHEGGVFWLGHRSGTACVQTVVLLDGRGVTEEMGHFEVSPVAFGQVGAWASEHDQVLLAMAHSHWGPAAMWLSPTDRAGAVHVNDVLAVVVPGLGSVTEPMHWGFHRYADGVFTELVGDSKHAVLAWTDEPVTVVRANEEGVVDA